MAIIHTSFIITTFMILLLFTSSINKHSFVVSATKTNLQNSILSSITKLSPSNHHIRRPSLSFAIRYRSFYNTNNRVNRSQCCFTHHSYYKTRRYQKEFIKDTTKHQRRIMSSTPSSLGNSNDQQKGLSDIGQNPNNTKRNSNNSDDSNYQLNWKERIDISIAKSRKIRGSNFVQISTINYETMEPRCRTVVFRGFLKDVPCSAVDSVLSSFVKKDDDDTTAIEAASAAEDGNLYTDCVMKMITDTRSNKVKELGAYHNEGKSGNTAEMVWWFPKSNEQYRVRGRLQFIGSNGPMYSYTDNNDKNTNDKLNNYFISERKQQWGNLSDMAREQFYWQEPGVNFVSTSEQAKDVPSGGRDADGKVLPVPDTFLLMLLYPTNIDYLKLGENVRLVDECNYDSTSGYNWESKRVNP